MVRTLGLGFGSRKIAVLQHSQQLSRMHAASAIHVERLHRRDDLGRNRSLVLGKQNGITADNLADGLLLYLGSLHRDFWLVLLVLLGTGGQQQDRKSHNEGQNDNVNN